MDLQEQIEVSASSVHLSASRGSEQVDRQGTRLESARSEDAAKTDASGKGTEELDSEGVQRMLDEAQSKLEMHGVSLRFKLNQESGSVQVEVRDPSTDKVIRKIPEDELLRLSSHIKDFNGDLAAAQAGTLMDKPI
ncbi:MAG: flagellar protein FlaG [Desulfovibrio sp.]